MHNGKLHQEKLHNFISLKNYEGGNRNGVKFAGLVTHLGQMID